MPWISYTVPLVAGLALGTFYFGTLWWIVQRVPRMEHPGIWMSLGFVGRTAVTLVGFFFVAGGRWERILVCLAGFLIARTILLRRARPLTVGKPTT